MRAKIKFNYLSHGMLLLISAMVNLPFFWMVSTSLKSKVEVFTFPPSWFPAVLIWENYVRAWNAVPFGRFFLNSIIVSTAITVGQLLICSLAAYSFANLTFKGKHFLFFMFLGTAMLPSEVLLIPNYLVMRQLGWIDTYAALTVPFLANAFTIFLLRQFFLTIPKELKDAALIDGCGHLRYLWGIVMPLSKPALLTAGLFTFMNSWNEYLWPLVVTNEEMMRTVQVGLAVFQTAWQTEWTQLMAASTFVTIPVIIFFLFVQRQFIEGISMTGING